MRQNGLRASSFVPVVDVDPRVADQLLDLLRLADVAAYSEPAPGSTGVYRDHHVPSRRLDRLWVDRAETVRARGVLDRALPHLQAELDLAIRDGVIMSDPGNADPLARAAAEPSGAADTGVATAGGPAGTAAPTRHNSGLEPAGLTSSAVPGPAAETPAGDVTDAAPPEAPRPSGGSGAPTDPPRFPGSPFTEGTPFDEQSLEQSWAQIVSGFDLPVSGPTPWPSAEDLPNSRMTRLRRPTRPTPLPDGDPLDEAHFVPPPPLPLPHLDPMTRLGWAAVIGGPALLVLVVLFGSSLPSWVPLLGVLVLVGGFGLLVSRLRPSSDDDDHHDGAVV